MFTLIVLAAIAFFWWRAHKSYESTGQWKYRRLRSSWLWAFIGASIGSFFGVAGFGTAIAGTIPGGIVAFLAASNLMKRDLDEEGRQNEGATAYRSSNLSANERVVGDGERNDVIPCPNCGQKLRVPSGMTLVVNCVKCQKRFVYP